MCAHPSPTAVKSAGSGLSRAVTSNARRPLALRLLGPLPRKHRSMFLTPHCPPPPRRPTPRLRQNLREKHSRHVADLRAYYESEIEALRDKLNLRDLPQEVEKANQALSKRRVSFARAHARTTHRAQFTRPRPEPVCDLRLCADANSWIKLWPRPRSAFKNWRE